MATTKLLATGVKLRSGSLVIPEEPLAKESRILKTSQVCSG
jgi:hypothetical protein